MLHGRLLRGCACTGLHLQSMQSSVCISTDKPVFARKYVCPHVCPCQCIPVCTCASVYGHTCIQLHMNISCVPGSISAVSHSGVAGVCICDYTCSCEHLRYWFLYVCFCLFLYVLCVPMYASASCVFMFICVSMYALLSTFLPWTQTFQAFWLSLISGDPASCSHQGTDGLCWVPPNSTPLPSPSAPAASASLPSSYLCPLLLCLSSSVCSLKQAWPGFMPLNLGPPSRHREIDTPSPPLASRLHCPPQPGPSQYPEP